MAHRDGRALVSVVFLFVLSGMASATSVAVVPGAVRATGKGRQAVATQSGRGVYALNTAAKEFVQPAPAGVVTKYAKTAAETPADANCGFATPCYSTIRAPEPQSLFLMGSGLVAMAGLVRRRLAR